jgi:hypothetical protein
MPCLLCRRSASPNDFIPISGICEHPTVYHHVYAFPSQRKRSLFILGRTFYDTPLRYPSTIPTSGIPSSVHPVLPRSAFPLFYSRLSATSTSASKSASVCNHQSCTYFFFVYMHHAFATHRRDASSALLHDGIFLLFQYGLLIIHVTCIHRIPPLYGFWSYRHRCPNGTALCFYFPLRPRFCRLMNWIRSGLVDRIGIRTWIWIWILVLATAFFMVLVLPGLQ